jgi:hypothetical protein
MRMFGFSSLLIYASTIERQRTDGSRFDHVTDGKSLDGLILRCASRAVRASNWLDVAAAVLVTSAGLSSVYLH